MRAVQLQSGKTVACDCIVCDDGAGTARLRKRDVFAVAGVGAGGAALGAMWGLVQRHVYIDRSILPVETAVAAGDEQLESTKGVMIIPPNPG